MTFSFPGFDMQYLMDLFEKYYNACNSDLALLSNRLSWLHIKSYSDLAPFNIL